jgi:cytoskeletal protein CcmA (bactofilin family)
MFADPVKFSRLPQTDAMGIVRASDAIFRHRWESTVFMKPAEGSTNIGKSVSIRGELSGTEDLFLDGVFDGSVSLPESRLTIGPNGHVTAELHVRDLIVFGTIDGNVHATGRIELRQTAILNGDILAARLSIEESATVRGRVELTGYGTAGPSGQGAGATAE